MNTEMNQWVIMIGGSNEFIVKNLISWIGDGSPNEWTSKQMNEWMNEWMNKWAIDVKMNERSAVLPSFWTTLAVGWNNCQGQAKYCGRMKHLFFFMEMVV